MYLGQCFGVKLGRSIAQLGSVRSLSQEVPRLIFSGSTACLIFPPIHPAVVLNTCRMECWWSEGLGRCIVALTTARTTSALWIPFTKAMATSVFNRFWSRRWVLGRRGRRDKCQQHFAEAGNSRELTRPDSYFWKRWKGENKYEKPHLPNEIL